MAEHVNDATLLDRFVNGREEAAFAVVMRRHAPLVRAACRRILRSEHDAEDVVQATFLLLALKASEVTWRESVAGWLCAVARRLSLDARAGAWRRRRRETPLASLSRSSDRQGVETLPEVFHPTADTGNEVDRLDLRNVLDDALSRLPEKYREPVVLCDLQGLTHSEAARRLGLPTGSMSRRLARARTMLRGRLVGRGLPLAILIVCGVLVGLRPDGRTPLPCGAASKVREEMARFRDAGGDGLDLERVLSRVNDAGPSPAVFREAAAVARRAARAAGGLKGIDPGHDRPAWVFLADDLERSADAMLGADHDGDAPALLAATRRANAVCVSCHLVFRQ